MNASTQTANHIDCACDEAQVVQEILSDGSVAGLPASGPRDDCGVAV